MNLQKLYFFTSSFPYGNGEQFIETEIKYLSESFWKIIIVPLCSYKTSYVRDLPHNCIVLEPIIKSRWQHYFFGLFCFKSIKLFLNDFVSNRVYKNRKWIKSAFIDFCTTNNLLQSKTVSKILKEINDLDLMYFFWGKGFANLIPFITYIKAFKVVRFHGGDLYDINYDGYIPIHRNIILGTNLSVFISYHGQKYLVNRYPDLDFKSVVSYLGSEDFGVSKHSDDGIFRLLSCSSVIPIKRVLLIYKAIQNISGFSVEWTHIGDGSEFKSLKNTVNFSRDNIKINLLGGMSHKDVILYYQKNYVDAFINVSSSEGLPVSIMEAISFDIPVIATNVGGTSEIVCAQTGVLLPVNPNCDQIILAIEELRITLFQPRLFWQNNFSAQKNFLNFVEIITKSN